MATQTKHILMFFYLLFLVPVGLNCLELNNGYIVFLILFSMEPNIL